MKTAYQILTSILLSLAEINISKYQIRKEVDTESGQELIQSVQSNGVIQPLLVTQEKGVYHLVAGFRRIHAAQAAKLDKVPCLVITGDKSKLAGFLENQFHEKMHPIDRAEALAMHFEDFGGTQREFAKWLGLDEKKLSEWMSLCKLDEIIKSSERKNPTLPVRELYPLARVKDTQEQISRYDEIIKYRAKKTGKKKRPKGLKPPPKKKPAEVLIGKTKGLSAEILNSYRDIKDVQEKAKCDDALIDLISVLLKVFPGMKEKLDTRFISSIIENFADMLVSAERNFQGPNEGKEIQESLKILHRALKKANYKKSDASELFSKVIQLLI